MIDFELLEPIEGYVDRRVLFGMDEGKVGLEKCTIFAFTSYKNRAPTFKLLLKDGSLFSFVPIHLIFYKEPEGERYELNDLAWRNCPDLEVTITAPKFLKGDVNIYLVTKDLWLKGEYVCSIDWHRDNLIMHLLKVENGQFAMLPSHKVKFRDGERDFKEYRKIKDIWEVDESGRTKECFKKNVQECEE